VLPLRRASICRSISTKTTIGGEGGKRQDGTRSGPPHRAAAPEGLEPLEAGDGGRGVVLVESRLADRGSIGATGWRRTPGADQDDRDVLGRAPLTWIIGATAARSVASRPQVGQPPPHRHAGLEVVVPARIACASGIRWPRARERKDPQDDARTRRSEPGGGRRDVWSKPGTRLAWRMRAETQERGGHKGRKERARRKDADGPRPS